MLVSEGFHQIRYVKTSLSSGGAAVTYTTVSHPTALLEAGPFPHGPHGP